MKLPENWIDYSNDPRIQYLTILSRVDPEAWWKEMREMGLHSISFAQGHPKP